jgi:NDP-sugar pyrophosphorylase family protein
MTNSGSRLKKRRLVGLEHLDAERHVRPSDYVGGSASSIRGVFHRNPDEKRRGRVALQVGLESNLGAGTITANLRHDGEPVAAGANRHPTGRRKFDAIVGSGTKTGINTSLQPGVVLPTDSWTAPGDVVHPER